MSKVIFSLLFLLINSRPIAAAAAAVAAAAVRVKKLTMLVGVLFHTPTSDTSHSCTHLACPNVFGVVTNCLPVCGVPSVVSIRVFDVV